MHSSVCWCLILRSRCAASRRKNYGSGSWFPASKGVKRGLATGGGRGRVKYIGVPVPNTPLIDYSTVRIIIPLHDSYQI